MAWTFVFVLSFSIIAPSIAKADDFGYNDYNTSASDYNNYNTSASDYNNYNTSASDYNNYNTSASDYNNYNTSASDYNNYNTSASDYNNYNTSASDYNNYDGNNDSGCSGCNTGYYGGYDAYGSGCSDCNNGSYYNDYNNSGCAYGCNSGYGYTGYTGGCTSGCYHQPTPTPVRIPQLSVSCSANDTSINVGDTATWNANASGGTGGYSFTWTGTDGLSGGSSNISKTYNNPGTKQASVTVSSGNQFKTVNCNNTVYVQSVQHTLSVSCTANNSNPQIGDSVSWSSHVSGGNGNYSYSWSGTDGLSSSGATASRSYNSSGTKNATVVVTSDGQSDSASCSTFVDGEQNSDLDAYCEASPDNVNQDEDITWRVFPSGGTGSYSYDWSGAVSGSSKTERESYSSSGTKRATVEVRSGNQTITRSCTARVENNNNNDLSFTCDADRSNARVGEIVNWRSDVSGGDGDYSYSWSTSDSIGGRNNEDLRTRYDSTGTKNVSLTVRSDGQSRTRSCGSIFIGSIAGFSGGVTVTNAPVVAPLSSAVYLSQVPYTGLELSWKLVAFLGALALWSVWIAYFIFRKKVVGDMVKNEAIVSSLEEEARKENVIVSEDAFQSIIKKAKKEKVIAAEVLKRVIAKAKATSGSDAWIALSKEKIKTL